MHKDLVVFRSTGKFRPRSKEDAVHQHDVASQIPVMSLMTKWA